MDGSTLDEVNLLELAPLRIAPWREVEGHVVIEPARPTFSGLRGLKALFDWWMGPKRIRLDATGSALWRRLDGRATVADGVSALRELFPDDGEHLEDRAGMYVRALRDQRLLAYPQWDPPPEATY